MKHLVDLHIHSNFSDGKLSIPEIVDLYGSKGFSFISITDHLADSKTLTGFVTRALKLSLTEKSMDQYLSLIKSEAKRAWQKYGMVLLPGVEVTLNSWSRQRGAHLVFLGVDRYINPNHATEDLLIQNQEYFSIAAHPLWEKSYEFKTTYLWENRETLKAHVDAWECATANYMSQEVYNSGLPVVASSDFHGLTKFESWKTQVELEEKSIENLFESIEQRRVTPVWC
jgi:hypothetical protein